MASLASALRWPVGPQTGPPKRFAGSTLHEASCLCCWTFFGCDQHDKGFRMGAQRNWNQTQRKRTWSFSPSRANPRRNSSREGNPLQTSRAPILRGLAGLRGLWRAAIAASAGLPKNQQQGSVCGTKRVSRIGPVVQLHLLVPDVFRNLGKNKWIKVKLQ